MVVLTSSFEKGRSENLVVIDNCFARMYCCMCKCVSPVRERHHTSEPGSCLYRGRATRQSSRDGNRHFLSIFRCLLLFALSFSCFPRLPHSSPSHPCLVLCLFVRSFRCFVHVLFSACLVCSTVLFCSISLSECFRSLHLGYGTSILRPRLDVWRNN